MTPEDIARDILNALRMREDFTAIPDMHDAEAVAIVVGVLRASGHVWTPPPGWTAEEVGDDTRPAVHVGNPNGITGHRSEDTAVIIDDPPWTFERETAWRKWRNRTGSVVPPADDPDTRDAAQIWALGELHAWEAKHGASVDTSGMDAGPMVTDLWGHLPHAVADALTEPDDAAAEMADALLHPWQQERAKP